MMKPNGDRKTFFRDFSLELEMSFITKLFLSTRFSCYTTVKFALVKLEYFIIRMGIHEEWAVVW